MTPIPDHFLERDNSDNLGQLFEGAPPNRAAAGSAGVPPAGRRISGKQAKRPMFSIISHPAPRLKDRTASFHFSLFTCHCARRALRHLAAPLRMESGRGEKDKQDTGGQGCGKGGGREDNSARRQLGQRFCGRSEGGMGEGFQPQTTQREEGRRGERGREEGERREATRMSRMPLHGLLEWLGGGRNLH